MSRRRKRRAPARPALAPVAPVSDELTIREAELKDLAPLHLLRLIHGAESAQAPVNPTKVMQQLVDAKASPGTHTMLVALRGDRLVGYLLLERRQYDYSDAECLQDWGFFVLPLYRNQDVGPALLRDARALAEIMQLKLYLAINNPSRRRGLPTGVERSATLLGFVPQGAVLAFGQESSANVLRQPDHQDGHELSSPMAD